MSVRKVIGFDHQTTFNKCKVNGFVKIVTFTSAKSNVVFYDWNHLTIRNSLCILKFGLETVCADIFISVYNTICEYTMYDVIFDFF